MAVSSFDYTIYFDQVSSESVANNNGKSKSDQKIDLSTVVQQ